MDLIDYDYGTQPYIIAKIFDVHALSNEGFNKYIGPESYAHKYLKKTAPKSTNTFYNSSLRVSKNDTCNISKINQNEEDIKDEKNDNPINNENPNLEENQLLFAEEGKYQVENLEKEKMDIGYKTSNAFFNSFRKSNSSNNNQSTLNRIPMSKTSSNFFPCKSNLDLLTRRLNYTSSNFKRTEYGLNNFQRFDKNYLSNIKEITKKDFFENKNYSEQKYKKKFDGFVSYNIPRLERIEIDNRKPMNILAHSIAKSCVGNKRVSYENAYSAAKLKEVLDENKKLKQIFDKQMSTNFLKVSSLPNISQVASQPKLKIKRLTAGEKIKHMGGKYNPYNFQAGRDCETIRRNNIGGLFQH